MTPMTADAKLDHPIVIFDGHCNLCAASVRFILANEKSPTLRFASMQSQAGQRLLRERALDPDNADSFVLIEAGRAHLRSDAALLVARHLRQPWRLAGVFRVVPGPLRDRLYNFVATHRYRWFGRNDTCMMPTPALRDRFLSN